MPLLPPMDLPLVEKPEVVIDGRADESAGIRPLRRVTLWSTA